MNLGGGWKIRAVAGAAGPSTDYVRHRPEDTVLFAALQEHWRSFLEDLERATDAPLLPAFVEAEVEAYLRCGILAHGFGLARCGDCGWSRPVAFSCQRRGFCPSCIGRRMADFAAHIADRVVPAVPVRQWVLTVPHALRAQMMFDPALTTVVLRELIAAVSSWLRRRARRLGIRGTIKTSAIVVIQRFNSAERYGRPARTTCAGWSRCAPSPRVPCFPRSDGHLGAADGRWKLTERPLSLTPGRVCAPRKAGLNSLPPLLRVSAHRERADRSIVNAGIGSS